MQNFPVFLELMANQKLSVVIRVKTDLQLSTKYSIYFFFKKEGGSPFLQVVIMHIQQQIFLGRKDFGGKVP